MKTSNNKPRTVQDIISEIEKKSKGGGYIYRGERKRYEGSPYYGKVSSNLWREYGIEDEQFDIELVQKELLAAAKKHTRDLPHDFRLDVTAPLNVITELTKEARNFEILTEIQHYGGKTNLIDFTTDYFIALFFACNGRYDEDGRIILQKTDEISEMIAHPRNPRHRVIVQKSVFIRPPRGFIEPHKNDIVTIPANLKQQILEHLRNYHGTFTEVIYNDIHGFIRNQNIHGDAYTHFHRGFACQNRADEAPTLKEKHREYEEAIKHYTEAIKLKPDLDDAYNNRGNVYYEKEKLDKAISDYNTAIKLNPDDASTYNNRGTAYDEKGEFDNAIRDYTEAIKRKPDYADPYNNRGITYNKKGEFDNAIRDYTEAIKRKPDYAEAHNYRGITYYKKGEFDNAIGDYTEAIKRKPDYAEAHNYRGTAYYEKGEFDNAIGDYTEAIKRKPDYAEAHNYRGTAYYEKGEFDNAIGDYTEAIKRKPDNTNAYNNRGNVYALKGEFDNAIGDYTEAIKRKPDYAETYNNRGVSYSKKGEFDNAIKDFDKVIQLQPNSVETYNNRGEVWLHLQEWEKAKSDLMTAKNMGINIITSFHNDYASVEDFEQKTGIQLPENIAALLTPLQA